MIEDQVPPDEGLIASLLQRWEDAVHDGEALSIEELCATRPELADVVRQRIESLHSMDWLDSDAAERTRTIPPGPGAERRFEKPVPLTLAGRYFLQNLIAEGGYGQVWRAIDSALDRAVAIKVTTLPCVPEARRVASLKHQGIISVHDVGNQDGFCFIVFDLVEGSDLAETIRHGRLPWREAVQIVAEVADYVAFAHRRGYVHRDIKPANILLDANGTPVLADFGIAVTRTELEQQITTTLGTVAYMAPEQFKESAPLDPRLDIYGLGIVLYEALTGERPFQAGTLWKLRERILSAPAPLISEKAPDVPPALDEICRRCLAKSPTDRYPTAESLAIDLRHVHAQSDESSWSPSPLAP